ncbi:MAG: 5-deoxy-glucuronate isomerase [Clostridia bacterium]|nr:5-deoxy-glucuronate isomerase [Clostridia bacterium]
MFAYPEFVNGKKILSEKSSDMLMDIAVYRMNAGDTLSFRSESMETAVLLVSGAVTLGWNGNTAKVSRKGLFTEGPSCLHVCKLTDVTVAADEDSEILVQQTDNEKAFDAVLYRPEDCVYAVSCEGKWENTAVRDVVTVFDYSIAPYSNMVLGEVYARQGRWWSYTPHWHPQPEVYYYKFDRPEGFGACFIGEKAYTVKDGSVGCFTGGNTHAQVTAPGYPMYNVWMIRHLPGDPWDKTRIVDPRYAWLDEE